MFSSAPLVLCVDDDVDDLSFITAIIHKVEPSLVTATAGNGREALTFLKEAKQSAALPALILLDINMPGMNGKETLASIKADSQLRHIPVVVFSTSSLPSDRLYCAHFGVDMITKPNYVADMERVLQKLIYQVLHD
jgi:CheY-like chemotaxis protein